MKLLTYVVFDRKRVIGTKKSKPTLRPGEFAILLRLDVAESIFSPEMTTVDVKVPERAVLVPEVTVVGGA